MLPFDVANLFYSDVIIPLWIIDREILLIIDKLVNIVWWA